MKTWNELNAEFTAERLKEKPDVKKLEDIYKQMLKSCSEIKDFSRPKEVFFIYAKAILLAFVASLIALAIFT